MTKQKRVFALLMAAVMTAGMLSGCKKEEATSIDVDKNGNYIPKKELELTVWETQGTDYSPVSVYESDVVAKWLKEKTKVTVKNMYGNDGGQWDSKLSKLVAGNNLPDMVHCGAYQGPAHFAKLNKLGQVWELTEDMIKQYAPNVWKRTPSEFWEKIKVDGKIFGIPYGSAPRREVYPDATDEEFEFISDLKTSYETDVTYSADSAFYIRDDILKMIYPEAHSYDELCKMLDEKGAPLGDELLDIPIKTTEEYVDFMYKIKELGLREGDKTVYAFGYTGGDNWVGLSWMGAEMIGYKNHNYTGTWNSVKQRIEIPLVHDAVKEAGRYENKMINDKVFDPESLAHTLAQYKEKVYNGQYAVIASGYVDNIKTINDTLEKQGKSYRFRPFITQVPALEEYKPFKEETLWTNSVCFLKTMSEADVIQVLNWINVQYSDEFEQVWCWGPEEAGLYTETEDGKRKFKDDKFNKYYIDGDTSQIPNEEDRLGLQGYAGLMLILPCTGKSKWDPVVMYRVKNYIPAMGSGFAFKKDSVHAQNIAKYPPCQIWSSVYAEIPEVVDFWAARDQWEGKFKMAIAANVNDFDAKWQEAIDEVNGIVDIKTMEDKMTEIAKPLAQDIK